MTQGIVVVASVRALEAMSAGRGRLRRVVGAYEVSFEVASVESPPGGGERGVVR